MFCKTGSCMYSNNPIILWKILLMRQAHHFLLKMYTRSGRGLFECRMT